MAELTQTELENLISAIDTQIATLTASPGAITSYTIGQKTVNKSQSLDGLLKVREMYQERLDRIPAEGYNRLAIDVNEFGEDTTENLGDLGE